MTMKNEWLFHVELGSTVLVMAHTLGSTLGTLLPVVLLSHNYDKDAGYLVMNPVDDTQIRVPLDGFVRGNAPDGSYAGSWKDLSATVDLMYDWAWLDKMKEGDPIWFNTGVGRIQLLYRGPVTSTSKHWVENPRTACWYQVPRSSLTPKDNPLPLKDLGRPLTDAESEMVGVDPPPIYAFSEIKNVEEEAVEKHRIEAGILASRELPNEVEALKAMLLTTERLVSELLEPEIHGEPSAILYKAIEIQMSAIRQVLQE